MRTKTKCCSSCRQLKEKLERNFRWKYRLITLTLIVLVRLIVFLTLVLTCYRERF